MGGYTYNSVYSGPIGSVITPHLRGLKEYQHLSFASSLCGRCAEVCPVKIPLPALLLKNRLDAVGEKMRAKTESMMMKLMEQGLTSRWKMESGGGNFKNFVSKITGVVSLVGSNRKFPGFSSQSFSKQWKIKKK